jgi:hypothetical protein
MVDIGKKKVAVELQDLTGFEGRCDALLFTTDNSFVPPAAPDERMAQWRRKLLGMPETPPSAGQFDAVVVGGGIAGTSAAIAAARLGVKVALVHDRPVLGGNASGEIRVWTGGAGGPIVNEVNTRSPSLSEDEKRLKVVQAEKNLTLFLDHHAFRAHAKAGRIESVDAKHISTNKELRFAAPVYVDCTGDACVGFWAGAEYRMGREPRDEANEPTAPDKADKMTLGTSAIWSTKAATGPVTFPDVPWATEVSKTLAATKGDWTWEYGHYLDTIKDAEDIRDYLLRAIYGAYSTARAKDANSAKLELSWVPYVVGKRESRRLIGDYVLNENDVVATRDFPDKVAAGSWSIDLHYPGVRGYDFRTRAVMKKVKPYPIPFRCLYSKNVSNLMMAGRNISVTHVALGTTRVMNTCGQMGVATGAAAFLCKKHNTTPRGVYEKHIAELQDILAERGQYSKALTRPAPSR